MIHLEASRYEGWIEIKGEERRRVYFTLEGTGVSKNLIFKGNPILSDIAKVVTECFRSEELEVFSIEFKFNGTEVSIELNDTASETAFKKRSEISISEDRVLLKIANQITESSGT
ncbi:MAG: hypothetical protein HFJ60_07445 [Clostridia bacterium]|jgi:hypothetical protein|nr:hypothetical protein [Clostridia bacterium]